jgi:hypothetical protein
MTEDESPYVGYSSPPEHSRFKKGKSGNPRGRPRKREDLNTVLQRVLNRKVRVKDNDRQLPIRDALIWKLRELALQGDKQALALHKRILLEAGYGEPESKEPTDARAKMRDILERMGWPTDQFRKSDDE